MLRNFSWVIDGRLAGMAIPSGAYRGSLRGGTSELERDAEELTNHGVNAVVSLTHQALAPDVLKTFGITTLHLPVEDMTRPTREQIDEFISFVDQTDGGVVVHCAAGIGRTGTMLGCYLVWNGLPADQAISRLRRLRPGSIETPDQEWAVLDFADRVVQVGIGLGKGARPAHPGKMDDGEVREATDQELSAVVEVMTAAFSERAGYDRRADFERRIASDTCGTFVKNRGLMADGTIKSALRIYDRTVRIGRASIRCAGVGDVATMPEAQNLGYGSHLVRSTVRSLAEQGYEMAWLTGSPDYYGRFGWHTCPCHFFEVTQINQVERSNVPCTVRTFDEDGDYNQILEIYDQFNSVKSFTVERSPEYWSWLDRYRTLWQHEKIRVLAASTDGRLVGYLILERHSSEWRILEVAGPDIDQGEIAALIATAGRMAVEAGVGRIRGVTPYDDRSLRQLQRAGIEGRVLSDVPLFGNVMVQILNLRSFLKRMIPELESRLRQTWQGSLAFSTEKGERVVLIIQGNALSVREVRAADIEISFPASDLTTMLLGYTSFRNTHRLGPDTIPRQVMNLLDSLFPETNPVYWATDYI